jgi:lipoprotein-releasing system permease protein
MFELFVAKRYLRAKRKQVVISIITVISVIGVAAGVMALVVALAVNNGMRGTLERNFLGLTAHISIREKVRGEGISNWREIAARMRQLPHVTGAEPALYDTGALSGAANSSGVQIKGVSLESGAPPALLARLKEGSLDQLRARGDPPRVILGSRLAEQVGGFTGKQVRLTIPYGKVTPFGVQPAFADLLVVGIFDSGVADIDSVFAFMELGEVQRLFNFGDVVNAIELTLDDIYAAPDVAARAEALLDKNLTAATWIELNQSLSEAFHLERIVTGITIGLILLVAALNILITLVMMVMEKHRDIAILMAMGARAAQIRRIFMLKGAIIGVLGTAIGLMVGHALSYFADRYQWIRLSEVYSFRYVPFEPDWADSVWISAVAMLVSLVATLYPARSATCIDPVEAMRYE